MNKFIEIVANYNKISLINALTSGGKFTFYSDESSDITSSEKLVLYTTFCLIILFLDILFYCNSNELRHWKTLSVANIIKALQKLFLIEEIEMQVYHQCKFWRKRCFKMLPRV